jgi:tetratricopeptide (TPR) repeat protein
VSRGPATGPAHAQRAPPHARTIAPRHRGNLDEALAEFARASETGSLDAIDQNNWGSALAQRGDTEGAAAHFEEAVRIDPEFDNARFHLGVTLEERGRIDEAMFQYEQVARRNPQHRAAMRLSQLRTVSR